MNKIILNVTDVVQLNEFNEEVSIDAVIRKAINQAVEAYCDDCEKRGYFISHNRWVDWACKENFLSIYFDCELTNYSKPTDLTKIFTDIGEYFDCGAYLCREHGGVIPREKIFTLDSCPELCDMCGCEPDEFPDFMGPEGGWYEDLNWPEDHEYQDYHKDMGCIGRNVIFWDAIFKYIDKAPQLVNAVIYGHERNGKPLDSDLSWDEWNKETGVGLLEILRKDI